MVAPRGIRNCNPGNIRHAVGTTWRGARTTQTDASFVQFTSMSWGVRALARTLIAYRVVHGLRTVRGLITRWAPPNENNTAAYVAAVAKVVGVSPDALIALDKVTLISLCRAIIAHENGTQSGVTDDDINSGVALAL